MLNPALPSIIQSFQPDATLWVAPPAAAGNYSWAMNMMLANFTVALEPPRPGSTPIGFDFFNTTLWCSEEPDQAEPLIAEAIVNGFGPALLSIGPGMAAAGAPAAASGPGQRGLTDAGAPAAAPEALGPGGAASAEAAPTAERPIVRELQVSGGGKDDDKSPPWLIAVVVLLATSALLLWNPAHGKMCPAHGPSPLPCGAWNVAACMTAHEALLGMCRARMHACVAVVGRLLVCSFMRGTARCSQRSPAARTACAQPRSCRYWRLSRVITPRELSGGEGGDKVRRNGERVERAKRQLGAQRAVCVQSPSQRLCWGR